MLPFAYYILKVIICSAILFAYYWLFLRNRIFHRYNRFYLLSVPGLSLSLPLIRFEILSSPDVQQSTSIQLLQVISGNGESVAETISSTATHTTNEQIVMWMFFTVSCFLAAIFVLTILRIRRLKSAGLIEKIDGIDLIRTEDKSAPFSFFRTIFWNAHIDISSSNGKRILKHELAHVEERHSHDKMFVNIILIFFWCNPVFWLLRKELNLVHEFCADGKAVEDGDPAAFSAMILQVTHPQQYFELTNNFYYSPIKRRLFMLTKHNKKVNSFSRLLVLPLAFCLFAAFTFKEKKSSGSQNTCHKKITVVLDAGHGGSDNGAQSSITSLFEKDINLALVKKIKALNTNAAVDIVLLRETDVYQSPKEKVELANKLKADLFISVHTNNGPGTDHADKSGTEVFVSKDQYANSEKSKLLASALIASLGAGTNLPVASNPMQAKTGVCILQESACPSVLIEAGYMNNKKDISYITSETGKNDFAKSVLSALNDFAASEK